MDIDVGFDFRADTPPGRDPDALSPTLRKYHKCLWSKPLPNGVMFALSDSTPNAYLHHRSEVGEYFLSSDSVIPTFTRARAVSHIVSQIDAEEREAFLALSYTMGGMMVFPGNRIDGKNTINGTRGFHHLVRDRFDLTLESIRRHYNGERSPLTDVLARYADFFQSVHRLPAIRGVFHAAGSCDRRLRRRKILYAVSRFFFAPGSGKFGGIYRISATGRGFYRIAKSSNSSSVPKRITQCVRVSPDLHKHRTLGSIGKKVQPFYTLSLVALVVASTTGISSPLPHLNYDELADKQCTSARDSPISPEWVSELRSRLPEMRRLWESVGPVMTRAVTALTKKPFEPTDTIRLTLCDMPSNAFQGPTVNMRYALKSFTETPVPLRYKVDTAFHEELHPFVDANVPAKSELLAAHASEPQCVRNHLHLLALQKAVLLRLNDSASLAQVVAIDGQLPSGCYKRAWTLVDSTASTYLQYVVELTK